MIKVIVYGSNGKMGQVLSNQINNESDIEIVAGIDRTTNKEENIYPVYSDPCEYEGEVDIIIDFSHPSNLAKILKYSSDRKIPLVIATTGYTEEQYNLLLEASKELPILLSSNMSLGINVIAMILKEVSRFLGDSFDIEIIEKHHNKKIDAPSGTAYLLANVINKALDSKKEYLFGREGGNAKRHEKEIGIHAIRGGTIPGEHTVIFAGLDEVIEIKHEALSKNIFAQGAIKAARFIINAKPGFYNMDDIF